MRNGWGERRLQRSTHMSGDRFEEEVLRIVKRYTDSVWHSVKIETLLTQSGYTEVDIVFYNSGIIYALELKRISRIKGSYGDSRWVLYGWKNRDVETSEYLAMNVIEQNNIHVRSLSDMYFSEFRCFPTIVSAIIVPNDCVFPTELEGQVFHLDDLEDFIRTLHCDADKNMDYRVSYLLGENSKIIRRNDFVSRGLRDGTEVRGKRR